MAKYWEIIESYGDKSRKSEAREAYECGYEEGYEAAMKEYELEKSAWEMRNKGERGPEPKEPVLSSPFVTANSSASAVYRQLDANQG